jgi:hypothetical protein
MGTPYGATTVEPPLSVVALLLQPATASVVAMAAAPKRNAARSRVTAISPDTRALGVIVALQNGQLVSSDLT